MPCDPATLLSNAQCWFACGSHGLDDALEVVLLCAIYDGDTSLACNPSTLVSEAQCLLNCIPQGMMGAVKLGLLCSIAQSGGSSSGSCLYCGAVDPVAPPTCPCALAYNYANGSFWGWDAANSAWFAFIGG